MVDFPAEIQTFSRPSKYKILRKSGKVCNIYLRFLSWSCGEANIVFDYIAIDEGYLHIDSKPEFIIKNHSPPYFLSFPIFAQAYNKIRIIFVVFWFSGIFNESRRIESFV